MPEFKTSRHTHPISRPTDQATEFSQQACYPPDLLNLPTYPKYLSFCWQNLHNQPIPHPTFQPMYQFVDTTHFPHMYHHLFTHLLPSIAAFPNNYDSLPTPPLTYLQTQSIISSCRCSLQESVCSVLKLINLSSYSFLLFMCSLFLCHFCNL